MYRLLLLMLLLNSVDFAILQNAKPIEVVYQFTSLDYDWQSNTQKSSMLKNGDFIVENNILTGIKVYENDVFVTVPRWRPGVPATLNKIVVKNNTAVLQPYPSWSMNAVGNCQAFQYVQSMEVDPNTGYMWIIDTGRINTYVTPPLNLCPPKIVIYDIKKKKIIKSYNFPANVTNPDTNFMNDLVLDYVDGKARYAYITDTADSKLYVYDYDNDDSYFFTHSSMEMTTLEPNQLAKLIAAPVDGIAISPDFEYVHYCALSSLDLWVIPTKTLRNKNGDFYKTVYYVGKKLGGSDGITFGQKSLFYAALEDNAIYKSAGEASLSNEQERIVKNDTYAVWVDTFAWNDTYLWYMANRIPDYFQGRMNFSGDDVNMVVAKVEVGERGYLDGADHVTTSGAARLTHHYNCIAVSLIYLWYLL